MPAITIDTIEEIVGAIHYASADTIRNALDEDADGTLALTRKISRRSNVRNPIGVLLAAIGNG